MKIMITGAGGTIGSALALRFIDQELVLVNHSELALHNISRELEGAKFTSALLDVCDGDAITSLIEEQEPDVIFHAAAIKHVPLAESNPVSAVMTNVLGTWRVAAASKSVKLILISTDKAVNPTSVMGATKRAAERVVRSYGGVIVRFCNVTGSSGSVVPVFQDQIERGGPVKITHPDVERFFITLDEAINLVLHAADHGKPGDVFVRGGVDPVRIMDLAQSMIGDRGIAVEFTGLRQGEKLREELFYDHEHPQPVSADSPILCGTMEEEDVADRIERLRKMCAKRRSGPVLQELIRLAPESDLDVFKRSLVV